MVCASLSVQGTEMPRRSAADINTPRFELVRTTPLDLPTPPAHLPSRRNSGGALFSRETWSVTLSLMKIGEISVS
jgi:hypothetical protein